MEYRFEQLAVEVASSGIATVTVNRPKVLNALNDATIGEIDQCFRQLRDDTAVRAVIVTGAGDRSFVAGADIKELSEQGVFDGRARSRTGQIAFQCIESLGKPVIAAINGFALGGGCELALACHLRVAADSAKIGLPEVGLAIIPGYGGTQRLQRIVGRGRALELVLIGDPIGADEAHRIGLVNRVFAADELIAGATKIAEKLLSRGPLALQLALDAVLRGEDSVQEEGMALEADLFGLLSATQDTREGMSAFLEKRPPVYRGE
ncbi:MAG: enoyl-CoA hydratase-related protein [Planctomycetota bacterium]